MARKIGPDPGHTDRVPPQNLDAERSVLGAMLLEKESCYKAIELLRPEHFYRPGHATIFGAIKGMFQEENVPIDLLTVTNRLREKEELEKIGGAGYLSGLVTVVPSIENTEHYAKIIRDKSVRRLCVKIANRLADMSYKESKPLKEIIEEGSGNFLQLSREQDDRDFIHMSTLSDETHQKIIDLCEKGPEFLPTPWYDFNEDYHGFLPGEYVIIAARPSVGKTSFALNITRHLTKELNKTIVFFSLEMSKEQVGIRLISDLSNVPTDDINAGKLKKKELSAIDHCKEFLRKYNLYIDDSPTLSPLDIRAKVKRLIIELEEKKGKLDLVVIDYMQLLETDRGVGGDNRVQQVTEISRSLKALAKEVNLPILVLSQLSRSIERRDFKHKLSTPQLSDLRESGAIEQDADKVIFLHRVEDAQKMKKNEFRWNKRRYIAKTERMIPVWIYISKNRNGPTGRMLLGFEYRLMKFLPYDGDLGAGFDEDDSGTSKVERD